MPHPLGGLRSALQLVFGRIISIYFREIEIAGDVPRPDTGGRLFAGNHVNGLVDPILVLTQAPCAISPIAKSTLWKIPGLAWVLDAADAVPIKRKRDDPNKSVKENDEVFERIAAHLGGGGNILIFPEGTSHNEPHLIALRSGAGRMLAQSRANGAKGLTVQAVALEFDERDIFRSRALVLFGPVRDIDEIASTAPDVDSATKAITTVIRDDLSELLVEAETWEQRIALVRAAEMFANDACDRSLARMNQLGRRIEEARRVLGASDPATVSAIEKRVDDYWAALEDAGASDDLVARFTRRARALEAGEAVGEEPRVASSRIAWRALRVVTLPLAVIGMTLWYLPYQVPRAVTRRLGDDPDVSSTYKLGVGLLVHPLWAALLIGLAFWRLPTESALVATLVVLASPFAALPWLDRWDRVAARVRMLAPSEDRRDRLAALAKERAGVMADLATARDRAEGSSGSGEGTAKVQPNAL